MKVELSIFQSGSHVVPVQESELYNLQYWRSTILRGDNMLDLRSRKTSAVLKHNLAPMLPGAYADT